MKKKVFTLLLALFAIATTAQAQVVLNETNFPDANFRKALASRLRINEGDEITAERIAATTTLNVSSKKIADLTGIEHFTALTSLYCNSNQLTSLDVSKNIKLTGLMCEGNQLTSLNVSNNTALTGLGCADNQLTSLNVSSNTALATLVCANNQLTSLNVSNNTALIRLDCRRNQLTELDVSKNTALTELYCYENQLTELDVSKHTALTLLDCSNNQLTALDVSNNIALTTLYCGINQLTSLDVSKNTALRKLWCCINQIRGEAMDALITSLPIVNIGEFYVIDTKYGTEGNFLTEDQAAVAETKGWKVYDYYGGKPRIFGEVIVLNAENFPDENFRKVLARIWGIEDGDEITKRTIAATKSLNISLKSIADLTGIKHFTALTYLKCDNNQLTELDVSKNTALESLECSSNQLTSLDVSQNTALTLLSCGWNQLTSLNVSKNIELTTLYCHKNQLTLLDVSQNTALEKLYCGDNLLTSLNVFQNTALTSLSCYDNQLTLLDVSQNTALKELYCGDNLLTSLNVFQNTALTTLYCYCNHIKGKAMDELVASLPNVSKGEFSVICTQDENEGNVCTKAQVKVAKEKGWRVSDLSKEPRNWTNINDPYPEYEGSDPEEEDINPVDEDDNVDFGTDMNEGDDLGGNVIGDIFYNIGNGNGEYNAEEGCIVLKKTTDDETVDGLSGKDIFGEDFKDQFTGIVFKVPSGKGTVKVTAETIGNMLLKVKICDNEPVEMELNGKLKISFPYNVSETTLVAIYAGANNEAKGFGSTNATEDAALKIYGIEFERGETTVIDASLNDNGQRTNDSWYTIDGKKLSGEPTKKGVYIIKGKKVKR